MDKRNNQKTVIFSVTYLGQGSCGYKDLVMRGIEIKETQTLVDLHNAIQRAIGWTDPHLYSFFMDNKPWSGNCSMEYTSPEQDINILKDGDFLPRLADIQIKKLRLKSQQKFLYVFDFGDNHHFEVKVFGFDTVKKNEKYPMILKKYGKAPKQYKGII